MGKIYPAITPQLKAWIGRQRLFFVATAPLSASHHVNCSPKGMDTFHVLDDATVCYFDYTGSGVETIAHLRENRRITFMFCAFEGPPKIVRLHGSGEVLARGHADWDTLAALFALPEAPRSVIKAHITRVSDSCGFGVPLMDFKAERDSFEKWAKGKTEADAAAYRRSKNATSIDGLPAWEEPA
jgi:Pyridoxamine 5'-phosphate oxidase